LRKKNSGSAPIKRSGKGAGWDEKEPPKISRREFFVSPRVHGCRRRYIEHREARDDIGIVKRHAMGDTATAIVTNDVEAPMPERVHQEHLVACHRAFGIGVVVLSAVGFAAVAVTA
jgi:hypothetical protein